jgi:tRNA isopentenyl-2-thiomethyl-A-37 hydroxylase MiaE
MAKDIRMGMNRTGAAMSPRHSKALEEASAAKVKKAMVDGKVMMEVRQSYVDTGRIGSVPTPTTLRGMGKALVDLLRGARAPVLMDRLSERLCSERSAVRMYEGLIGKYGMMGSWPGGPDLGHLQQLRAEELEHFHRLHAQLEVFGADPTALSPSADLAGVAMMGVHQVIADPRTDLRQCLDAMLVAELTDKANWESLHVLALQMGHDEMAEMFGSMLAREARHLSLVQSWVAAGLSTSAGLQPTGEKAWKELMGNGSKKRSSKKPASRQPRARA